MIQGDLFAAPPKLSPQCRKILQLFRENGGRVSNVQIAEIALKYTNRICDLRAARYDIRVVEKRPHGVRIYELVE